MKDGVYFGMPREEYHAIPRLSGSGIKLINSSPEEFWAASWMNPARVEKTHTEATQTGELFHDYLLEGPEVFHSRYHVLPDQQAYRRRGLTVLSAGKEIYPLARELGLPSNKTLAKTSELILKKFCPIRTVLWPQIMEVENAKAAGRKPVPYDTHQNILNIEYAISENPDISCIFKGGAPEVSILWTDKPTGVKMKARTDYLKPIPNALAIIDLKSFSNTDRSESPSLLVCREIARHGYLVQPLVYNDALKAAHNMSPSQYHGDAPSDVIDAIKNSNSFPFVFLFVHSGGLPIVIPREFRRYETGGDFGASENEYWKRGARMFRAGIATFKNKMDEFGPNRPWIVKRPIEHLKDGEFPIWMFEDKEEEFRYV